MTFLVVCAFWCAMLAFDVYTTDFSKPDEKEELAIGCVQVALILASLVAVHTAAQA